MLLHCDTLEPPMSLVGQKRTSRPCVNEVRFTLKADMHERASARPLCATTGNPPSRMSRPSWNAGPMRLG
jgi:hypothetical protein